MDLTGASSPGDGLELTILILNYNTREYLHYCLSSIYANRPKRAFETIVVDNASSDGSVQMLQKQFPQVKVVETGSNLGFAGGNNAGFRVAQGEFVFILNPDTIVLPGCIDLLVDFLRDHPRVGAVGPWIRDREPDVLELRGDAGSSATTIDLTDAYPFEPNVSVREVWVNRFRRVRLPISLGRVVARPHTALDQPAEVDWVLNCASLIRRADVDRPYLMDETWFIGTEEIEFCCGWLSSRNYRFFILPRAQIIHFGGRSYEDRPGWADRLYPLMHAAIYARREDIFGPKWARADSMVGFLDHLALYMLLGIMDMIKPQANRRVMRQIYKVLMRTDLRLLQHGRVEADRINTAAKGWVEHASAAITAGDSLLDGRS